MSKSTKQFDGVSRSELTKLVRMQAAAIKKLEKRVEELESQLKVKNPTDRWRWQSEREPPRQPKTNVLAV